MVDENTETIAVTVPYRTDITALVPTITHTGEFSIVVSPIVFSVKCIYGDKTLEIASFNSYVERTVAIPEGVDPEKITTGIVVEPDGTVRHVPTKIKVIDGKYYAVINSLTNSIYSVIWHPQEFQDAERHWAKDAINDMGSRMVINGVGKDRFEPDNDITRGEFAAVIVRALGLKPGAGENKFSDVNEGEWYCRYIETATQYHVISGYGNGKFGPEDKITREQAMSMIGRAMEITGLEIKLEDHEMQRLLAGYSDAAEAEGYAGQGISACIKAGIVSGRSNSILAPKDSITRAEVVIMVQRLLRKSELID